MIKAHKKDEALIKEIRSTPGDEYRFDLWWLGQSGYLIKYSDKHLLIDPYLSDSLTKKYAGTDKPHIRMSELVVDPSRLDFIDIVTSSHNHTDHLDGKTIRPLLQVNPDMKMIIPEANRAFVADRIGSSLDYPISLNDGEKVTVKGFTFHGIPAAHNTLDRDDEGRCKYMGYVIGFGPFTIYHSGDTLWHEEILDALGNFDIDLALLPINGNKPERRVAGNLDASEAVALARHIGAGCVLPCHYDMFTFNTADPEVFVREARKHNQPYAVLPVGGHLKGHYDTEKDCFSFDTIV